MLLIFVLVFGNHSKTNTPGKPVESKSQTVNVASVENSNVPKLSPQEWLKRWNEATRQIFKTLPQQEYDFRNALSESEVVYEQNRNRDKEVIPKIKELYPELYKYIGLSEYTTLLQRQRHEDFERDYQVAKEALEVAQKNIENQMMLNQIMTMQSNQQMIEEMQQDQQTRKMIEQMHRDDQNRENDPLVQYLKMKAQHPDPPKYVPD